MHIMRIKCAAVFMCILIHIKGIHLRPKASSLSLLGKYSYLDQGSHYSGKFHRCSFSGHPDAMRKYLTTTQTNDPSEFYYGRSRKHHYYQHLFVESECTNGLPKGRCFASLHKTFHCGSPNNWSILSSDEIDGPGIMWRNENPCPIQDGLVASDVEVTIDYFCPNESEEVHLYRCTFDGKPTAATENAKWNMNDSKESSLGYFSHVWSAGECDNGLPPENQSCIAGIKWQEHCGDDHDWEAISPTKNTPAQIRWYTSHQCDQARVAVDYYCPIGPTIGTEGRLKIHSCAFEGKSIDDGPCLERMHSSVGGSCRSHTFTDEECDNGRPKGLCVVAQAKLKECGGEQNFEAFGGDNNNNNSEENDAKLTWYNLLPSGPCGDASIQIDYYCDRECVKSCNNGGILDEANCNCDCQHASGGDVWGGPQCSNCLLVQEDCFALGKQLKLDEILCDCV